MSHPEPLIIPEDPLLPIANVASVMKKALPETAKISLEAKRIVQECVSELIRCITGQAVDSIQAASRKKIQAEDIISGFEGFGLEHYAEALKRYLSEYRKVQLGLASQPRLEAGDSSEPGSSKPESVQVGESSCQE